MVYEYTVPRVPIAATFGSPGPRYGLPTLTGVSGHDSRSTHRKQPAWQFGVKHHKLSDDAGPGPVHYPDVQCTRTGRNGAPHYSLYSRPKDLSVFKPPGPGSYCPENAGPSAQPKAPAYSLAGRTRLRSNDAIPSPNSYTLPRLLGKTVEGGKPAAPAFTQTGRSRIGGFSEDLQRTPGPGTYSSTAPSTYQRRDPSYSFRPAVSMPGDSTLKPGPGAHSPERVKVTKKMAPSYSFGIRHSNFLAPLIIDPTE